MSLIHWLLWVYQWLRCGPHFQYIWQDVPWKCLCRDGSSPFCLLYFRPTLTVHDPDYRYSLPTSLWPVKQRPSALRFRVFTRVLRVLPFRLPGRFTAHIGRDWPNSGAQHLVGDRESDLEPEAEELGVQPLKVLDEVTTSN